jgi:hypothetical protein
MDTILEIAKKVRIASEIFALSSESKSLDFHGREDLGCMCATASFALYTELKKNGYDCVFVSGRFKDWCDHCWVEIDGMIVDITATQFSGIEDDVLVVPSNDDRYKPYSSRSRRKNMGNLSNMQKSGWPKEQAPSWRKVKKYFVND